LQRGRKHTEKIKVVVVTAGHGFKKEPFFEIFESCDDIEYVEAKQQDHSELFEDISGWDADVIVLYNMTQEISPARQENFTALLNHGVGLVALHHSIGAYQKWPGYRKIIGGRYYLSEMEEDGVIHGKSNYKHGLDIAVHVSDKRHPITRRMKDFVIHDEAYKKCVFEKDNHVLLTTNHPASDEPLCWVRRYGRANVCYIQLGHGPEAYANENFRRLVSRAIRWSAGRLD
jgi:type 1 glutamine amidotransferase